MRPEVHVACDIFERCIGVCCGVIEELFYSVAHGFDVDCGDGSGNGADRGGHGGVYCSCVVKECAEELLDPLFFFVGEWFCCWSCRHLLGFAVFGW